MDNIMSILQKNFKKFKGEKGITLVALVITIVILIILATVTINVAFGEGGLIQRAQQAKNLTEQATRNEQEMLNSVMDEIFKENGTEDNEHESSANDGTLVVGPKLSAGMIPVKYVDGTGWIKTNENDEEWYNYGEKKWANVVLGEATFNQLEEDEVLDETKPYSMLVWIPRYAYKITSMYHFGGSGAGNIEIKFLDENNKDREGNDYNLKVNYPKVTAEGTAEGTMNDFVVHPAFTFGAKELSGFWIGKFETSQGNESTIQIKGGVQSWRTLTLSQMYDNCRSMNEINNIYGMSSDDTIIDPHLMKNTEWGAVAYLSKSIYGKSDEVEVNNNSDFYTGGGIDTAYISNVGQSTTGNVYGAYDMSGGAYEYTAAYYQLEDAAIEHGLSVVNAQDKYKDVYSSYQSPSLRGIYGDAIYETSSSSTNKSSWYSDYSWFASLRTPFFRYGGLYNNDANAGVFCFYNDNGNGSSNGSFRVVVPVL